MGGGRQGVAQGAAAQGITQEFARGVTDIRSRDVAQRDALAQALASQRAGATSMGIAALPQQYSLANEAALAPLSPYLALSQILGDPTVLNKRVASSSAKSKSFSVGMG